MDSIARLKVRKMLILTGDSSKNFKYISIIIGEEKAIRSIGQKFFSYIRHMSNLTKSEKVKILRALESEIISRKILALSMELIPPLFIAVKKKAKNFQRRLTLIKYAFNKIFNVVFGLKRRTKTKGRIMKAYFDREFKLFDAILKKILKIDEIYYEKSEITALADIIAYVNYKGYEIPGVIKRKIRL